MKYAGFCDFPLDDRLVLVEASTKDKARDKIKTIVAFIGGCDKDDVSLYNCFDEFENPELVLGFVTTHGGDTAIAWEENPLILLGDEERKAAYERYYLAMQDRAAYDADQALGSVKNK